MRLNPSENMSERVATPFLGTVQSHDSLNQFAKAAIEKAQQYLLGLQNPHGYWIGELIVDVTLTSDSIILMHWLGKVDEVKQAKCAKHILSHQLPGGGWSIYVGGPNELNATVKAYWALKLAGISPEQPMMRKAHATILRLGGIPKCNTYMKLTLALLGQYEWDYLPAIPPEVVLLPNWLYFNIYHMSSWSRGMLIPLAIVNHYRPTRFLPEEKQLHELFPYGLEHKQLKLAWDQRLFSWRNFFLAWNGFLTFVNKLAWRPFRARAMKKCEEWMLARMGEGSDGLAAIFPAMMYSIVAMRAMGYSDDHPSFKKALKEFYDLEVDDVANDDFRIQPCFSPVWDTAITGVSLIESGLAPDHPQIQKAAEWLLTKEVTQIRGDWVVQNPHSVASGWAFEFNNVYYPDVDDTLKVLLFLRLARTQEEGRKSEAISRALEWVKSFQCENGGWAAFDKDVYRKWLEHVPFADHNAILDPPCSDISARALELFGKVGVSRREAFIQRCIAYLKETQESDGSWYGRWGVNYIYGTWQSLRGLQSIGEDMNQDWILRGRDWLESCQNDDGGWGESCASYDHPELKGQGPSTASQTGWAMMGLIACGDLDRISIKRGIDYICKLQNSDGSWSEEFITGTGFPCVFYLKYDMYRLNWPLLALADYRKALAKRE